jgi:signal peptidase I
MTPSTAPKTGPKPAPTAREEQVDFVKFLIKLALFVLIVRSFLFSPFSIPSESMQPRLLIGDFLIVNKMAYGYSRYSLPFGVPLIPGRIFSRLPERGDVAVFKAPPTQAEDYIKRVIGLPGDRIQVTDGLVSLNGKPIERVRVADAIIPVTANMRAAAQRDGSLPCFLPIYRELSGGRDVCRYPRYRETLPNGRSYDTLDVYDGGGSFPDTTEVYVVPKGHLFLMGDNRDRSADSRFPAVRGRGIGLVPVENLVGKAMFTVFSTDGAAQWYNPVSWVAAARWGRVGEGF